MTSDKINKFTAALGMALAEWPKGWFAVGVNDNYMTGNHDGVRSKVVPIPLDSSADVLTQAFRVLLNMVNVDARNGAIPSPLGEHPAPARFISYATPPDVFADGKWLCSIRDDECRIRFDVYETPDRFAITTTWTMAA